MQEIRILFSPSEGCSRRVSLTDGERKPIGVELSFEPFLSDDDYDKLRWYLEEFMELPDGGAVIRAQRIEADLLLWPAAARPWASRVRQFTQPNLPTVQ